MLYYSPLLALVALAMMPLLYRVGIRMRKLMFPISWVIQARLAGVATVVDENVNGVRVVKSFAQEEAELRKLADAAKKVEWAYIKDADIRGHFTPWVQNLPQMGLSLVLGVGGWLVINGTLNIGEILAFNLYFGMLQAPFMMLGQLVMMGQRAKASAERIFEILDERTEIVERPDAVDLDGRRGARVVPTRRLHLRRRLADPRRTSRSSSRPASRSRSSGDRIGQVDRRATAHPLLRRDRRRRRDRRPRRARRDARLAARGGRRRPGRAVPLLRLDPRQHRLRPARRVPRGDRGGGDGRERRTSSSSGCPTATTPSSASAATRCRVGSASAIAIARTLLLNPPILVLDDATSSIDVHVEPEIHEALARCSTTARRSSSRTGSRPSRSPVASSCSTGATWSPPARTRSCSPRPALLRGARADHARRGRRADDPTRTGLLMGWGGGVRWRRRRRVRRRQAASPAGGTSLRRHPRRAAAGRRQDPRDRAEHDASRRRLHPAPDRARAPAAHDPDARGRAPGPRRASARCSSSSSGCFGVAGPLLAGYAIDHGSWPAAQPTRPDRRRRVRGRLYLVLVGHRRLLPARAGPRHGQARGTRHARPAHPRLHAPPAAQPRLLHRGEGRRADEPDDERHREPPAVPPRRHQPVRHPAGLDGHHHRHLVLRQRRARGVTVLLVVPLLVVFTIWFHRASERGYLRAATGSPTSCPTSPSRSTASAS